MGFSMFEKIMGFFKGIKIFFKLISNIEKIASEQENLLKKINEHQDLLTEIQNLKEQLIIKGNATFNGHIMTLNNEIICQKCFDTSDPFKRSIIRLVRNKGSGGGIEKFLTCLDCKNIYWPQY